MSRLVGIALLALAGCAGSGAETSRTVTAPVTAVVAFEVEADRSAADCETLMADPRLDPLRAKLAVSRVDDQTRLMLASPAVPSAAERHLVRLWAEKREACRTSSEPALQRLPRPLAGVMRSAYDAIQGLTTELGDGKLSWGEFARRRAAIDAELRDVSAQIETALLQRDERLAAQAEAGWARRIEALRTGTAALPAAYRRG